MAAKKTASKKPATPASKKVAPKAIKPAPKPATASSKASSAKGLGWLQDATLEIPVPPGQNFAPGSREVEISVGMRQQENGSLVRSELRGRVLVHSQGQVLALAEASYVLMGSPKETPDNLPQELYSKLKPELERLLAIAGHKPPLPASLDKIT